MLVVVALGGNALLRRGEELNARNQRANIRVAAGALAELAKDHRLVISHGNGPQVGLLAMQSAADPYVETYPLDVLGAESGGMIGYLIEQELGNLLPEEQRVATLLTQIEVDANDPAFQKPTKPIGPGFEKEEAGRLVRERGWTMVKEGECYRRVVPSPRPQRIFEIGVIRILVDQEVLVICSGGGGIPTAFQNDGSLVGVEAVIDKDRASALLAKELNADAFLMLTDVDAVWEHWGQPDARAIRRISPEAIAAREFPAGSMAPKVEGACSFVNDTGGFAAIGALQDAAAILRQEAGTCIAKDAAEVVYYG